MTSAVDSRVISWTSYSEWSEIPHNAVLKCSQRELDLVKEYATHDFDAVLNLYYAKARFYDADNRRFTAVDPILVRVHRSSDANIVIVTNEPYSEIVPKSFIGNSNNYNNMYINIGTEINTDLKLQLLVAHEFWHVFGLFDAYGYTHNSLGELLFKRAPEDRAKDNDVMMSQWWNTSYKYRHQL